MLFRSFVPLVVAGFLVLVSHAEDGRHVALEGQSNFRDIGGYKTSDGKSVRRGLVFRSGHLSHLSSADVEKLRALRIGTVYNFLTEAEIKASGKDRLPDETRHVGLPIDTDDGLAVEIQEARQKADFSNIPPELNPQLHRMLVIQATKEYAALLKEIAKGDEPIVFHCSHGIHRTGTATAILLWGLGVPWKSVREDYLLSNVYRKEEIEKRLGQLRNLAAENRQIDPANVDMKNFRAFYVLQGNYIDAMRDEVNQEYGSVQRYLTDALGLTANEVSDLRKRLLVD